MADSTQIEYFIRSISLASQRALYPVQIELMRDLSGPYRRQDSIAKSFQVLMDAIELATVRDSLALPRLYAKLAYHHVHFDNFGKAAEQLHLARILALRQDNLNGLRYTLYSLLDVYEQLGDERRVVQYSEELFDVLVTDTTLGPDYRVEAFVAIGNAAALSDKEQEARAYYQEAISQADALDHSRLQRWVHFHAVTALSRFEGPRKQLTTYEQFVQQWPQLSTRQRFSIELAMAKAQLALGQPAQALKTLASLERPAVYSRQQAYFTLVEEAYVALGKYEKAYRARQQVDSVRALANLEETLKQATFAETKFEVQQQRDQLAKLDALNGANARRAMANQRLAFICATLLLLALISSVLLFRKQNLSAMNEQVLRERVDAQTRNLIERNQELEEFNRVLSHDLKEPLRSVISFSDLALRLTKGHPAEEYLGYVQTSGKQLNTLVEDILAYQRERPVNLTLESLTSLVAEETTRLKQRWPHRPLEVTSIDLPYDLEVPMGIIGAALDIVFSNAALFNDASTVHISLQYVCTGAQHRLLVSDNGIGIEKSYHERVFELFRRLHVRERYPGSGLGLARLRKLLTPLDGHARVHRSAPGQGTCIEINWSTSALKALLASAVLPEVGRQQHQNGEQLQAT